MTWYLVRVRLPDGAIIFGARAPLGVLSDALRLAVGIVDNYARAASHGERPITLEVHPVTG